MALALAPPLRRPMVKDRAIQASEQLTAPVSAALAGWEMPAAMRRAMRLRRLWAALALGLVV